MCCKDYISNKAWIQDPPGGIGNWGWGEGCLEYLALACCHCNPSSDEQKQVSGWLLFWVFLFVCLSSTKLQLPSISFCRRKSRSTRMHTQTQASMGQWIKLLITRFVHYDPLCKGHNFWKETLRLIFSFFFKLCLLLIYLSFLAWQGSFIIFKTWQTYLQNWATKTI